MKTKFRFLAMLTFAAFFVAASHTSAQDSTQHKMMNHKHKMEMKSDSSKNMNMHSKEMATSEKSPLVREGEIDLQTIDKNKDGKVFEDQMDWNVLSDTPGKCPLCGMKLKEVTLEKAKENLIKHGFKVKEMHMQK